ncbi:ABC transporter ATP-binding protein [Chromatiales bacterium (ex Bugula neritina AB1)]|nr:ABC transporter ATP-binding protein [Chromatiales bacterium (ex Bugula neritina AB1)]
MTLELKNVTLVRDGSTHIYPTELSLVDDQFNILLGTTLAGKTTLMRLMAGLDKPTAGEVWFDGKNVTGQAVQKRNVAMVYQQFINYPNFTVYDNIASPMKLLGKDKKSIDSAIHKVADLLKLTPMLDRMPNELSGGQQQRTALARALVKNAQLVLLDEPLANLDYKLREELRDELPKLFRDTGATVVYATTEPTEALLLGGYSATLYEGSVIQFGPTAEVYRNPVDQRSAGVFSDPPMNTTRLTKKHGQFSLDNGVAWQVPAEADSLADGDYTLGVRPHHLTLAEVAGRTIEIDGEVLLTEISGSESTVHARVGDNTWISLSHGIHPLSIGQKIKLHLDTAQCLLFDQDNRLVWS